MKDESRIAKWGAGAVIVMVLLSLGLLNSALAQVAGDPASYNSSSAVSFSNAYVDASVPAFGTGDICARIFTALSAASTPSTGVVIDARAMINPSHLACGSTETPWVSGSSSTTKPATILLPAGTITIRKTWVLPNHTRIIGQGTGKTQITDTILTNSTMITMGLSTQCSLCTGVTVEDLSLNGANATGLNGITNAISQDFSYVRNVGMNGILGTGISVTSGAANSGPYENIGFSSTSAVAATRCVSLAASTRGIHGLSCVGASGGGSSVGVALSGSGNIVEDATFQGFTDGISVTASNQVLVNIAGGVDVTNVIELGSSVSDVSIIGLAVQGLAITNGIKDDTVGGASLTDPTVAMYVLGEPVTSNGTTVGYSRFTTSLNMPTWAVMGNSTNTAFPSGSCVNGSIVTNSAGVLGSPPTTPYHTMWVCSSDNWVAVHI